MVFYEFLIQSEATTSVNIKVSFRIYLIFCSFLMPFFSSGLSTIEKTTLVCLAPAGKALWNRQMMNSYNRKASERKIWISAWLISMALELSWLCAANLDDRDREMLAVRRFAWHFKGPWRRNYRETEKWTLFGNSFEALRKKIRLPTSRAFKSIRVRFDFVFNKR